MEEESLLASFEDDGVFYWRNGPARGPDGSACQLKLCFTSTAIAPMARVLRTLAARPDCWFVKLDRVVGSHGMVRGRCFLTDREAVLQVWREYKTTDELLCTVQDDDLTRAHR